MIEFGSSVPVLPREESTEIIKKDKSKIKAPASDDDLKPEYEFDYSKAQPNRFAARFKSGSRVVVLDPDVAQVFTTPESVNKVLRALLKTMPAKTSRRSRHSA
jgi:hypothetical protein